MGVDEKIDTRRTEAEAKGNNLARWLTAQPPNNLDAVGYAGLITTWPRTTAGSTNDLAPGSLNRWVRRVSGRRAGQRQRQRSIVRLRYRPDAKSAKADLSLVGKGIIFDTGGTNLKPFEFMLDMHGDMQGSAVALGTFLAISEMELPIAVDCWLAITENRTGPNAYKSQDVVTAANGKTIQTVHTDAEGRMALADALVLASRDNRA